MYMFAVSLELRTNKATLPFSAVTKVALFRYYGTPTNCQATYWEIPLHVL